MKIAAVRKSSTVILIPILIFALISSGCTSSQRTKAANIFAFVNVALVPMDSERVLENQTVIIRDGLITEIGLVSETTIPEGATQIDGRGKYLMPGLADMHTHIETKEEVLMLVAHGVTTIRNMWGAPYHLAWRDHAAKGEMLAPTIYAAGPIIDGYPPDNRGMAIAKTAKKAAQIVEEQKRRGYDFIKVYNSLSKEAYEGIISAAKKHSMPVAGHIPYAVGLREALKAGQASIEHLDGFSDALQKDDSPFRNKFDEESWLRSIDYVNERKIPALVQTAHDAGAWVCPTLVTYHYWGKTVDDARESLKRPEVKYVPTFLRASWDPTMQPEITDPNFIYLSKEDAPLMQRRVALHKKLTKALADAGVGILLGTDESLPLVVPGVSVHEELQLLVDAGLTPYQAIKAGTSDAAKYLKASDKFGTVAVGKRADLILLEGNPLNYVSNVQKRVGVMIRGQWLTASKLQEMLDEMAASHTAPKAWFRNMPDLPTKGSREFFGRYEITINNLPKGEERFAVEKLPNGNHLIVSQLATTETEERYTMLLETDEGKNTNTLDLESDGQEGRGNIRLLQANNKLQVTGRLPVIGDVNIEENVSSDVLLDAPNLSADVLLSQKLRQLAVGKTIELKVKEWNYGSNFNLREKTLKVKREPDLPSQGSIKTGLLRVYTIEAIGQVLLYKSKLTVDERGIPFALEVTKSQGFGIIKYRRVE
jgi:imidazolonepropionase-like amidohydrolase